MYKDVQYGQPFSKRVFAFWVVDALIVSILVYFIPTYGVEALNPTSSRSDGLDSGMFASVSHYSCWRGGGALLLRNTSKGRSVSAPGIFLGHF